MASPLPDLSPAARRRFIAGGLLRALITVVALLALYFLVPLGLIDAVAEWIIFTAALLILIAVTAWQVRAIVRSSQPGLRGIEALAIVAPLYLILFSASYFVMARADPGSFSAEGLTRVDTLYFTVTVFATVGFGDISPVAEGARLLVTFQMILNLIVLGAGVQLLAAAVRRGRQDKERRESTGTIETT